MPAPTFAAVRDRLQAATDPGQLVEMTAAQLATLAGPHPTEAAAAAIAAHATTPNARLAVSAGALRPELNSPPPAPPPAPGPATLNQAPPLPAPPAPATKTT